jgi:hypothetical protein
MQERSSCAIPGPGDDPDAVNDAVQRDFWSLSLNYPPGATKQSWEMIKEVSKKVIVATYTEGEGDRKQVAGDVCALATSQGAKLD